MVPVLETSRLILRAHRPDDFEACAAMWADPVVTRHIGGRPLSGEEAWTKLLRNAGHWAWMDFGYWVIEDKATGTYLGETGFADYKRNLESSARGLPEMGWILVSAAHGRGIGTEAVSAAVAWGDARFGRTCCIVEPGNAASIRLAEKVGFGELERTSYHGSEIVVFDRTDQYALVKRGIAGTERIR